MKSCEEFLAEIREKVTVAEDQLRSEKSIFYKNSFAYKEQREQWEKEVKAEQLKVHNKEKELKKMQTGIQTYDDLVRQALELEATNDRLKKDLEKAKKQHQDESSRHLALTSSLEKELTKLQDQQKELRVSNKWAKMFQEKDLKAKEAENESLLRERAKELSDELNSRLDTFEDYLKDIERHNIVPKQQKLNELRESLAILKGDCEDVERKNKELEAQIATLQKLPEVG